MWLYELKYLVNCEFFVVVVVVGLLLFWFVFLIWLSASPSQQFCL